jgi:myo-inositol-1(or 4)-monophosphatase
MLSARPVIIIPLSEADHQEAILSEQLEFALQLARDAGQLILEHRRDAELNHAYKGGNELVTDADLAADKLICDSIRKAWPEHGIVSEESAPEVAAAAQTMAEPVWIIDPIDGTVNYARGHFQSAVSIAYSVAGEIQLGVVYNPFMDEMFSAERGQGAFLNGAAIRVSAVSDLRRSIIATGFPYIKQDMEPMVARLRQILNHCADIRRLGSAALDICWLAAGRLDGYYESLSLWDFAAARLIAQEAGARCGNFSPVPAGIDPQFHCDDLLIANPELYPQLLKLLQQA